MAGLGNAPLVTDTVPSAGARDGGWLARLRTTPGRLRAAVALVVLLACGLGLLTGMVFAALDSGFTAIGGHDAPLVEQSNALSYAVSDMDAQVGNVLLTGTTRRWPRTSSRIWPFMQATSTAPSRTCSR